MTARRVEKYVEAVRERRALERAYHEEPTPFRAGALRLASERVKHAEACLNGTQLGKARRLLAGQTTNSEVT